MAPTPRPHLASPLYLPGPSHRQRAQARRTPPLPPPLDASSGSGYRTCAQRSTQRMCWLRLGRSPPAAADQIGGATLDVLMVCLPRMYRHRPPEIRGSSVIRKKLLLDRLAVAAHSKPRSCGMKNQRESSDSRSASRHARALIRAARQAPGGVSLSRRRQAARERNGARSWSR